jgi:outer membrane immunogenic protein
MRAKIAFIAALASLLSAPAFAQAPPPVVSHANGSLSADASSWLAGGQAGYNWQANSFVYGLEADLSGMNLKSEASGRLNGPASADLAAKTDWYGSVRGRLGWIAGPWLLYGTGGLAYGKVDLSSRFDTIFPIVGTVVPGSLNAETSPLRVGWVAGAGFEYLLLPNVTLGVGYQHVDLGSVSLASSTSFTSFPGTVQMAQSARVHAAFHVVAASLNWHFSPTNSGGPWDGFYIGGHAGSAWGNSASGDYFSSCTSCVF